MLPYRCLGLQIGYVYLHHCKSLDISPKSSSNTKLTSKFVLIFSDSYPFSPSFLSVCGRSVLFCYLAKVSYYERFSTSYKLFPCDLTTNDRLKNSSPLLKYQNKSINLCKYCFLSKENAVLIQQTVLYLPSETGTKKWPWTFWHSVAHQTR